MEKLYNRKSGAGPVISIELSRALCELSNETGRQVGILLDRNNVVQYVMVGSNSMIMIPQLSRFRLVPGGLRGLRLVHTHLFGEPVTADDLTDLALLRLDSVSVLYFDGKGNPNGISTAYLLPPDNIDKNYSFLDDTDPHHQDIDYPHFIDALEDEISKKTKELYEIGKENNALLVGSYKYKNAAVEYMAELEELAESAHMHIVAKEIQVRNQVHPKYIIGPGRLKDIVIKALSMGADFLIFDNNLTPAQSRAISEFTELKVIDRTQLILDIFARRAQSNEGKIRVELAQLKYIMPRLSGRDDALSRLTGGIGGRGPGETKLEIDKRRINDRIAFLSGKLKKIEGNRDVQRGRRKRNDLPVVSIIGYTNAGKSTLLNSLTKSDVYADNLMFATLDTSTKRIRFPQEKDVIITDTVGFIRDLPDNLKGAFKSTLEELNDSDLLVHVVDVASEGYEKRMMSVNTILNEMGMDEKEIIVVFNKIDLLDQEELISLQLNNLDCVCISAVERKTFKELLEKIRYKLFRAGKETEINLDDFFE